MTTEDSDLTSDMRRAIRSEVSPIVDGLRVFVDRRIAELSAEVHAAVQMVDYSESNLSGQLARIHDQIATMVAMPAAATRNSGIELEAVVQATEAAANTIMEAAEAISDWLRDGARDPASLEQVAERINTIFEACTFQDVTGQRIRRAIQHLQQVETMLDDLVPTDAARPAPEPADAIVVDPDLMQDEIDRLLA
ncbi:MAG: hypothetical protein AB7O80_23290 [Acetobacteraceae bacterium]